MRNLTLCFLTIFLCCTVWAQPHQQLAKTTIPLSEVEDIVLPKVDNKLLQKKELEARTATKARAIQFAEPLEVSVNPKKHGTWEYSKKGNAVWRVKIHSANAYSLNLGFSQFFLPKKSQFFIYTPDRTNVLGPFTSDDNDGHKQLWTPIIEGDEVVLELQIKRESIGSLLLELGTVNHDFMGFGMRLMSGACNVDVVCGAADGYPRVDQYRDIIRSAAVYSIGGTLACSGALINNARSDCTPYFLTADHCGISSGNASSVVVYWNYENSYCREPDSADSGATGDGPLTDFNSGSTMRATYQPSDFTLIELDDPVSETAQAYFAGWDRSPNPPGGAIGIHHPNTDEKRISFEDDPCTLGSFFGAPESHIRVNDWDLGTTEPGSSGSPLFNPEKQIIGQLSGGLAACGNNEYDEYGWIAVSWEGGGSPATRLRDWLDPDGTDTQTIGGKDCSYGLALTQNFAEICNQDINELVFDIMITDNFFGNVGIYTEQLPEGLTLDYSDNPIEPGGTSTITIGNLSALSAGIYSIEFLGTDGFDTGGGVLVISVTEDVPLSPSLIEPSNGAIGIITSPSYEWGAITDLTYSIQIALDAEFSDILESSDDLSDANFIGVILDTETTYYWRTKAFNACGEGEWSETFSFTTADIQCSRPRGADLPVGIPNFPPQTITSTLEVNAPDKIADLDVVNLQGTHSFIGDLIFELVSPTGTVVTLISERCGNNSNFDINFSDDAQALPPCPYTDGGTYRPAEVLSTFNGESPTGVWTLRVTDTFPGEGGSLNNWGLQICTAPDFELLTSETATACVGTAIEIPIQVGGAFEDVGAMMDISGLPNGAVFNFNENPATPGETVVVTIENLDAIGIYPLTISASDGMHNSFTQFTLTVLPPVASGPALNLPADGSTTADLEAELTWGIMGGINGYHIEMATDEGFDNIIVSEVIPSIGYMANELDGNTIYYWRVSGVNVCGNGPWSETFRFTTPKFFCTADTNNEPVEIGNDIPGLYTSTIDIVETGSIISLEVRDILGTHSFVSDLIFRLTSPSGTTVQLLEERCGPTQNFDFSINDEDGQNLDCPLNQGLTYRSEESLGAFLGEKSFGVWTLEVEDTAPQDGGSLDSWSLQICTEPDYSLTSIVNFPETCTGEEIEFELEIGGAFDETAGVELSVEGLPMGASFDFDGMAESGSIVDASISGIETVGSYTVTIIAADGTETASTDVTFVIIDVPMEVTTLNSPANGSMLTDPTLSPTLEWNGMEGITVFELEVSDSEDFNNIIYGFGLSITSFTIPILDGNTTYYWRVRPTNNCGAGPWSEAFRFTTPAIQCLQGQAADTPIEISPALPDDYISTVEIMDQGIVLDVNVSFRGTHSYIGDLIFTLVSPSGTEVVLVNGQCTESETFDLTLDDEATDSPPCPYDTGDVYLPQNPLATFNGEVAGGTWILRVRDNAEVDGGDLAAWDLDICIEPQEVQAPIADFTTGIDGFNVFVSDKSDNATTWFWDFGDGTTFEGQTPPIHTYAAPGDYEICLTVTNTAGENKTCQTIQIIDVAIDPILANNLIRFYPNPTKGLLNISFDTSLQSDTRMEVFGMNGQLILQQQLNDKQTANTTVLDLSHLSTGIYMVRLTSSEWSVAKKVVKE